MSKNVNISSFKGKLASHKNKFIWLIFSVIGISTLPPPVNFGGPGLDPSCLIGIPLISFKHFQFGHDITFITGPLGYFYFSGFVVPFLWFQSMLYALFVHFFFIFSIALLTVKLAVKWKDVLFVFLLFVLSYIVTDDRLEISLSILLYLLITDKISRKFELPLLIFVSLSLAIEFLIKFDMVVAGLSIITMYSIIAFTRKGSKNALVISASYAFFVLILWVISDQYLTNLPSYFIDGLELSSGYTYGLALPGPMYQVYEGLAGVILVVILFIYSLAQKSRNLTIFILLNSVLLFESFKHGFVRQDLHVISYFWTYGIFFVLSYIIYKYDTRHVDHDKKRFLMMVVLVLASVLCVVNLDHLLPGLILPDISKTILSWKIIFPLTLDKSYQTQVLESIKNGSKSVYQLDEETIRNIGNKTMDVLPWEIALPWVYDFNWSPNPSLQSFEVLSPQSDKLNAEHFSGDKAPRTILYSYESIDNRYPLFDEPLTFATILHNYQYVHTSGKFALLSYNSKNSTWGIEKNLGSMRAKIGESIKIPKYNSGYEFAYVDLKFSPLGKFMNIVYKPSLAHIRFKLSDQTYSDEFRFIPMVSNDGIFVSQYVSNVYDLQSIFAGKITQNIDEMKIWVDNPIDYENSINVKFIGVPANVVVQNIIPDWGSLKLVHGGIMAIDTIDKQLYSQVGNVIDISNNTSGYIRMNGWAVDDLSKDGTIKTFLVFQDGEKKIILSTQKVLRPDVAKYYGVDSYQYGGWTTGFDTKRFGHECYKFSLRILRSSGQEYFDLDGGKLICFGPFPDASH